MRRTRKASALESLVLLAILLAGCYAPTVARQRSYHPSDADLTVTRIVHGSVILDFGTTRILVDPWFSPSPPLGPRETIGIALDHIPAVRGILITHGHNDHFDRETLENYPDKQIRIVTVRGLGSQIRRMGYDDVVEVDPWESTQIGSVVIVAVPARHRSREVGYMLQANDTKAYLAGDTLFDDRQFERIAAAFPSIDVALLPVGGIRVLGRKLDMGPEEAARAVEILKPQRVIPYHYGLTGPFPFVLARSDAPRAFARALKELDGLPPDSLVVLEPGESWHHYR